MGTYSPAAGASSAEACTACPYGKVTPFIGAVDCIDNPIEIVCVDCPSGSYSDGCVAAMTMCTACPDGKTTLGIDGAVSVADCTDTTALEALPER
jgi:hypothetical protein